MIMEVFTSLWNSSSSVNWEQSRWIEQLSPFVDKCDEALQRSSLTELATTLEPLLDITDQEDFLPSLLFGPLDYLASSIQCLNWENRHEAMAQWLFILETVFKHPNDGLHQNTPTALVMVQLFLRLSLREDLSRLALVKEMQMQSITYVLHYLHYENLLKREGKNSDQNFVNSLQKFLVPSLLFLGYVWYKYSQG